MLGCNGSCGKPGDMASKAKAGKRVTWGVINPSSGAPMATHHEEETPAEKMKMKVTSVLNKLTPEKYESQVEKMIQLIAEVNANDGVDGAFTLEDVVNAVYEVAVTTKKFSTVYAELCFDVSKSQLNSSEGVTSLGKSPFRRQLINKCQSEFDSLLQEITNRRKDEKEKTKTAEEMQREMATRKRAVANIHFVGELFKRQLITEKIMHQVLRMFLSQKEVDDEQLETMTQLMFTIGKQLDTDKAKEYMDYYIKRMKELQNSDQVSTRVKFFLMNVIELREERDWVPRNEEDAPQKLDDFHRAREMKENRLPTWNPVQPKQFAKPPTATQVKWSPKPATAAKAAARARSEERRVGKECRSRWSPYH
eukprot:TRINITY_DN2577_c0_g3_i1.p1 TRINITY_DN2577_c0_g3~~TRINITY_DN2577_c0_g3_i1.p1  ORF type:complete len:407 (+),score=112.60 TRINITY_DN2577_c0_g3_i1:128-1222(+)